MTKFDPDVNYRLLLAIMEAWLEGDDEQARSLLALASEEDLVAMLETMDAELRSRGMPVPGEFSALGLPGYPRTGNGDPEPFCGS